MVDFGPAREGALERNLEFNGFPITVTRPVPNDTPITTRGLWLRPLTEGQPYGTDFRNVQPRRTLVLPKAQVGSLPGVPSVPRGTIIAAPEKMGGANVNWRIDGVEPAAENDCWYVAVVRVN